MRGLAGLVVVVQGAVAEVVLVAPEVPVLPVPLEPQAIPVLRVIRVQVPLPYLVLSPEVPEVPLEVGVEVVPVVAEAAVEAVHLQASPMPRAALLVLTITRFAVRETPGPLAVSVASTKVRAAVALELSTAKEGMAASVSLLTVTQPRFQQAAEAAERASIAVVQEQAAAEAAEAAEA